MNELKFMAPMGWAYKSILFLLTEQSGVHVVKLQESTNEQPQVQNLDGLWAKRKTALFSNE